MRKFLVALAVLLIVYVAADIGARFWAQAWVGGQFQRSLHLSKSASVSFGGILFIPEVASGHIPSATVHAASFSASRTATSGSTATWVSSCSPFPTWCSSFPAGLTGRSDPVVSGSRRGVSFANRSGDVRG